MIEKIFYHFESKNYNCEKYNQIENEYEVGKLVMLLRITLKIEADGR